jgi:hypothetical protein
VELALHILFTLAAALLCLAVLKKWHFVRSSGIRFKTVKWVFGLKIGAGLILWAIYTYHYSYRNTSDAFRYFDDALVLYQTLKTEPQIYLRFLFGVNLQEADLAPTFEQLRGWSSSYSYGIANDNPTIIRLNMVIALFSQGFYHVHTVVFCFLSTIGMIAFIRGCYAIGQISVHKTVAFISVSLLPTIWFWGSGVLKEAPLIAGIGALLWCYSQVIQRKWKFLLGMVLALFVLAFLKPYVLVAMLPALIALSLSRFIKVKPYVRYLGVLILSYTAAVNAGAFYEPGNFLYILQKKQTDFYNVATLNEAGSTIAISPVDQSPLGFLTQIPERITTAFIRPFPWEVNGLFYVPPMVESLFLLFLLLLVGFKFRSKGRELIANELFCFALSCVVVLGVVIGSAVPVLGAVVRYRLPGLMFASMLIPLVLYLYPNLNRRVANLF